MSRFTVNHGDCLAIMPTLPEASVDSIVTDPPYGLSFMGKDWDHGIPGEAFWSEALRVAKPGAFLLAFGGTRTFHRLACAIEDAGWEVRDCIMWVYGSGFPKSHNLKGAWQGWGTALKPAWEPIIVARKPLCGTVADNVLRYGTGAMNVGGCRVGIDVRFNPPTHKGGTAALGDFSMCAGTGTIAVGRWPANLIHDGSEEVVGLMPVTAPAKAAARGGTNPNPMDWGNCRSDGDTVKGHNDSGGSAARFFYCAKASKRDRDEGCEGFPLGDPPASARSTLAEGRQSALGMPRRNHHPTVKPTDLMRYLCRLVTQPGGTVLDPFTGSGSTGKAAMLEGLNFIGCELSEEYVKIAEARISDACNRVRKSAATDLFGEKECK